MLALGLPSLALRRGWIDPRRPGSGVSVGVPTGPVQGRALASGWSHWILETWTVDNVPRWSDSVPSPSPALFGGLPSYAAIPWAPGAPLQDNGAERAEPDRDRAWPRILRVTTLAAGWPFRAVAGWVWEIDERPASAALHVRELPVGVLHLRPGRNWGLYAPASPLWGGMIANTLLLGGAWSMLIGGASALLRRRAARRLAHRGHCPGCGYDRRGLPAGSVCPECGDQRPALPPGAIVS
ncbi:MAG: hypothetical protein JNJ48_05915 [Phycisphaerae bacterium]|nr:hypothetical protein [Phycisphaerae bacterium]